MKIFIAILSALGLGIYIGRLQSEKDVAIEVCKLSTKESDKIDNYAYIDEELSIGVATELEVQSILSYLKGLCSNYGTASVGDLYEFIEEKTIDDDYRHGWSEADLRRINYRKDPKANFWVIKFPRVRVL